MPDQYVAIMLGAQRQHWDKILQRIGAFAGSLALAVGIASAATGPAASQEGTATLLAAGNEHYGTGDYDGARAAYTKVLAIDAGMSAALSNRALALIGLGDFETALADLDAAIRIDKESGVIWNNRANLNCRLKRIDAAHNDRLQALYWGRFTAAAAQAGLRSSGYYYGLTDGIWGTESDDALLEWTAAGCPSAPRNRLIER